jgi:hypothetical protein
MFLVLLVVCVAVQPLFWVFVIEHMFRGKDSILTIILDEIVLEKKTVTKAKRSLAKK